MELGIETIKKNVGRVYEAYKDVQNALADDGKITFTEWFSLLPNLYAAYQIYNDAPEILAEWQDIDADERQQLKVWFAVEFDIENDRAERIVEKIWNIIVESSDLTKEL